MTPIKNNLGFSLVEVLAVLAIVSLILGGATVFSTNMVSISRLTETTAMSDSLFREAHMLAKYKKQCSKVSYSSAAVGSAALMLSSTPASANCCTSGSWTSVSKLDLRNIEVVGMSQDICFNEEAVINERVDRTLVFKIASAEVERTIKVFWLTGKVMSK